MKVRILLPLILLATLLLMINVACSNGNDGYIKPTPTPKYNKTMADWKMCVSDGVLNIPRVNYWDARKDRIWFECLEFLPEGKHEEAKIIMNAIDKPEK